jgi:hypothetical protein
MPTQIKKSQWLHGAETMQEQLGPALCLAKWKQVSLHLPTGMNNSCYHPPLHSIDPVAVKIDSSALHNTAYKKTQRKMMLAGEKPTECQYCWNMEDQGKLSDRHYRSGEPWAAVDFEQIKNSTGEEDVIPSYVEVNFNHACNLRCSYCSPQFSSSWVLILLAVHTTLLIILWVSVDQYQPENQILMLTPFGPGGQTCTLS